MPSDFLHFHVRFIVFILHYCVGGREADIIVWLLEGCAAFSPNAICCRNKTYTCWIWIVITDQYIAMLSVVSSTFFPNGYCGYDAIQHRNDNVCIMMTSVSIQPKYMGAQSEMYRKGAAKRNTKQKINTLPYHSLLSIYPMSHKPQTKISNGFDVLCRIERFAVLCYVQLSWHTYRIWLRIRMVVVLWLNSFCLYAKGRNNMTRDYQYRAPDNLNIRPHHSWRYMFEWVAHVSQLSVFQSRVTDGVDVINTTFVLAIFIIF